MSVLALRHRTTTLKSIRLSMQVASGYSANSERSSRDLHNSLHEVQERSCGFVSLGESWCDTTSEVGRLMLTIMGGIGEFERGLIRKRCEEGNARAKAKGKQLGRPT